MYAYIKRLLRDWEKCRGVACRVKTVILRKAAASQNLIQGAKECLVGTFSYIYSWYRSRKNSNYKKIIWRLEKMSRGSMSRKNCDSWQSGDFAEPNPKEEKNIL